MHKKEQKNFFNFYLVPNIPSDFAWVFITHIHDAHHILFSTCNKSIFSLHFSILSFFACLLGFILIKIHFAFFFIASSEEKKKMLKNLWKLFYIPVISFRSEYIHIALFMRLLQTEVHKRNEMDRIQG